MEPGLTMGPLSFGFFLVVGHVALEPGRIVVLADPGAIQVTFDPGLIMDLADPGAMLSSFAPPRFPLVVAAFSSAFSVGSPESAS